MLNKEQWIDEVMKSAQGMQPADGNPFLHTRVAAKLQQPDKTNTIPVRWALAGFTLLALLIVLNISQWNQHSIPASSGVQQVAESYGWSNNTYAINY